MTRREILSQKIGLMAQRLGEEEGPDLEVIANKAAAEHGGRSGGLLIERHQRRMQTLKALLAERLRLEKDETNYPLTPDDEGTWHYDLRSAVFSISDGQTDRLYRMVESDCHLFLGANPEPFLQEAKNQIDSLRSQYLHEAHIMKGERELRKKASPAVAPSQSIILNIKDSQISGLNVAGIVGTLQASLTSIQSEGGGKIAEALKGLAEAIANEPSLPAPAKQESLECVSAIGEELARPTDKRRLGVLKATGAGLLGLIKNTHNLYAGYEILKIAVKAGTGFDLP